MIKLDDEDDRKEESVSEHNKDHGDYPQCSACNEEALKEHYQQGWQDAIEFAIAWLKEHQPIKEDLMLEADGQDVMVEKLSEYIEGLKKLHLL